MITKSLKYLSIGGLFAMLLFCRHQDAPPPSLTQATDQIARIREWYGDIGSESRYTYDAQGRLATQTTESYRDGDYGHEISHQQYQFSYGPASLSITRIDSGRTGYGAPTTVELPLTRQGLVTYTTGLLEHTYWVSNGVSSLFRDAVAPLYGDTLRVYDAEDHLLKTTYAFSQLGDDLHMAHSLTNGNIDRTDHVSFTANPYNQSLARTQITLYHHLYDMSKPGLRSPHQFLGRTNRNLIVKTIQTDPSASKGFTTSYTYEYDANNRVKQYTITDERFSAITGNVYYNNP